MKKTTNKFIFDVDGTLTPSRQHIEEQFQEYFLNFCRSNKVYLVTGSDYQKTLEQLGEAILSAVEVVYNCSGSDVWVKGKNVKTSNWLLPDDARAWLETKLKQSKFVLRTGNHIEDRPGSVNFSVVGRNATFGERELYKKYDIEHKERELISLEFNHQFADIEARIGGDTGIDIFPKGMDKSQILKDFTKQDRLYFFGDKNEPGGNDFPLGNAIEKENRGLSININNWIHTYETLHYYQEAKIAQ